MAELAITIAGGATLVVPGALNSITTYVLLEQERWFEKEAAFLSAWIKPGMKIIDIGANLGVYSVPLARLVGPAGRVFAYEPAADACRCLATSRETNALANLEIVPLALSDRKREGFLHHGVSGELHSLTASGGGAARGESVGVSTLDDEAALRNWLPPDFVKIDAEGEEERIVRGGEGFFSLNSPLVMFEIKAGDKVNLGLVDRFRERGYGIYRAVMAEPLLVPFDRKEEIDGFELNLFAAKPDRAAKMEEEGFLLESVPGWEPDEEALNAALGVPGRYPYANAFAPLFMDVHACDRRYLAALAGYATWRSREVSASMRYAALCYAQHALDELCRREPTLARLSTLARASWDMGRRSHTVLALQAFAGLMQRGSGALDEPFWPSRPGMEAFDPGPAWQDWFIGGALEQLVRAERFSSLYGQPAVDYAFFDGLAFASTEMHRRRFLRAICNGEHVTVPERLRLPALDHVNAEIWREGKIPGSLNL